MVWHLVFGFAKNRAVNFIPLYRGTGKNPKALPLPFFPLLHKSKIVAWEQGPCAEKASAGKEIHAEPPSHFRRMRRAHRAPGRAPLHRINRVLGKRMSCPPGLRNERCLMVFSRKALALRPGKAQIEILPTATWRKAKRSKLQKKRQGEKNFSSFSPCLLPKADRVCRPLGPILKTAVY